MRHDSSTALVPCKTCKQYRWHDYKGWLKQKWVCEVCGTEETTNDNG